MDALGIVDLAASDLFPCDSQEVDVTNQTLISYILGHKLPNDKKGWLTVYVLLLIYFCFLLSQLCETIIAPALKILAYKLHLSLAISESFVGGISQTSSLALFFINVLVCSARTQVGNTGQTATTSSFGLGLFFANVITRACIVPAMTQINFISVPFLSLPIRYVQVFRDLAFAFVGIGFLLRAFVFAGNSDSFILPVNSDSRQCVIGDEEMCCFQRLGNNSFLQDSNTYYFEKIGHGVIAADELLPFFYIILAYFIIISFQEKIEFFIDRFKEKAEKGYTLHFQLIRKLHGLEKKNDFLLYFKNNIHSHNNVSKRDEKMRILSKFFVLSCPVNLFQMFLLMDQDDNQRVDYYELVRMFEVFDMEITDENGVDLIKFIDIQNTEQGKVSLASFTKWFVTIESMILQEADLIFDLLEHNGVGYVLIKELLFFLTFYFNAYSSTLTLDSIHLSMNYLRMNRYKFISREQFVLWFRYFLLESRLSNDYAILSPKINPKFLQYNDRVLRFLESNTNSASSKNVELYHVIKGELLTEVEIDGLVFWPFSHLDSNNDHTIIARGFKKFLQVMKLPMIAFLFILVVPCCGRLKDLSFIGALIWLAFAFSMLTILSVLIVYFAQTVCLTLDAPFEVFSFFVIGFMLNFGYINSIGKLLSVSNAKKARFKLSCLMSSNWSAMTMDVLVTLPLSMYLCTTFSQRHILFSNYDTNLVTSLLFIFQIMLLSLVAFLTGGYELNRKMFFVFIIFATCFLIQLIVLASYQNYGYFLQNEVEAPRIVCQGCTKEESLYCYNTPK